MHFIKTRFIKAQSTVHLVLISLLELRLQICLPRGPWGATCKAVYGTFVRIFQASCWNEANTGAEFFPNWLPLKIVECAWFVELETP